ncbi:hypothetical protein WEI85_26930 [Actinomycetes bacterium KLBMP 9797]
MTEILPQGYLDAETGLRRLAGDLDSRRPSTDRSGWRWYPELAGEQPQSDDRIHYLSSTRKPPSGFGPARPRGVQAPRAVGAGRR